jgi:hypothetical protein
MQGRVCPEFATADEISMRSMRMKGVWATMAVAMLLAACASSASSVSGREDYLAAAGFLVLPGNAPGYAAALQQLPPHQFAHHTANGLTTYYYLDPTDCGCLYYGNAQAWATYQQEVRDKLHVEAEEWLQKDDTPYTGQGGI